MKFKKNIPFVGTRPGLCGDIVLLGIPYDGSETFRKGTKAGPASISAYSDSIESFSPEFEKDIADYNVSDAGSIIFKSDNKIAVLSEIEKAASFMIKNGKKAVYTGGEHLVTFPIVKKYAEKYPGLKILYFDAHADSRDAYGGDPFSHSAVVHLMADIIPPGNIFLFGIRSFEKKEHAWLKKKKIFVDRKIENLKTVINAIKNSPVYISIDLDVFDPGIMQGVGNPEAGGIFFKEYVEIAGQFSKLKNIVAADVVELAPQYDASGASSILACKVMRELILSLCK